MLISPNRPRRWMVKDVTPNLDCQIVFGAMDAGPAGPVEEAFAAAGYYVFSNARSHRYDEDAPILLPEINAEHAKVVEHQHEVVAAGKALS